MFLVATVNLVGLAAAYRLAQARLLFAQTEALGS